MASVIDQAKSVLPNVNTASAGHIAFLGIITIIILVIVAGFFALWAYWYISKRKFNKTIKVFEKVDGRYRPTITDKAMERKIGTGGDTVFYLQKQKIIIPRPSIQTGDNTYWFVKREDGELINVGLEDVDLKFKELGVYYLDKETRYARASLQKINRDRFLKEKFWDKYGKDIMMIIFIVIVVVMLLLIASKLVELTGRLDGVLKASETIMDKAAQIMGNLDNVCSKTQGSGLVPA